MKKIFLLNITAISLLCCACGCSRKSEETSEPEEKGAAEGSSSAVVVSSSAQKESGITVVKAQKTSSAEVFQAVGHIMQDAQATHHIASEIAGRLQSVAVSLGQRVSPGDTMAVVRSQSGTEEKLICKYKGMVSAIHANTGDAVDENTFIFTVTEVDPLWGVIDVQEIDLSRIRAGQRVAIRTVAYPDKEFSGTVSFVSPEIDPASRTVKARVSIANPNGLMKFGMFIDASVETDRYFNGIFLPAGAVQNDAQGTFVFVKKADDKFVPQPVKCGGSRGDRIEIKSGINPGDEVVADGAYLLKSEMFKTRIEGE